MTHPNRVTRAGQRLLSLAFLFVASEAFTGSLVRKRPVTALFRQPSLLRRSAELDEVGYDVGEEEEEQPDRPFGLVSALPIDQQQLSVGLIFIILFAGTFEVVTLLNGVQGLSSGFYDLWRLTFAPLLGLIYTAAGVTHFTNQKDYAAIVPPEGTWGFFTVPTPGIEEVDLSYEDYHVAWTGVAEALGGFLLVTGGLGIGFLPKELPAFALFLLTVAITPANVYMFTHDAKMGELPDIEYPNGHAARAALQCVLLGLLWKTAFY